MSTKHIVVIAVLSLVSSRTFAQDADETIQPNSPAPTEMPPPPPPAPPAAPGAVAPPPDGGQPAPPPSVEEGGPQGQWVFTGQYGWVWTPYQRQYTYVGPQGDIAYSYVYYPGGGWRWALSPWVLGWGPHVYWGSYGMGHYYWHAHPWFHVGVYRPRVWGSAVVVNRRYVVHHERVVHEGRRGRWR